MGRCTPADWGDYCAEHLRRLCRAGFLPMASLVIGLPGEIEEDVRRTLAWVKALRNERITIFPMLHAPIDGSRPIRARDLTRVHWGLIAACYRLNFQWIPKMSWDNQAAAGVSVARRMILQTVGRGQVMQWNALFAIHGRRARP